MSTFSCGAAITKVMAVSEEDANFILDKIKELEGLGATLEQAQKSAVAEAIARLEKERQEVLAAVREKLTAYEKDGSAASTTMNTADQDKKGDSPSSASTGESVVQPTPEIKEAGPAQDSAQPAAKAEPANILDAETSLWNRITDGTATVDEFKAGFENWVASKDAIIEALSKSKKDDLLKMGGSMFAYRNKSETKPEIVEALWRDGANQYVLARSFSHGMGKNAWLDGVRNMVENTDADQLAQYAKDRKAAQEEAIARVGKLAEAIKDPKTLDDFKTWMRATMSTGITQEQFTAELTKAFGPKVAERLQAQGIVVPVTDKSKIPGSVSPFLRDGDKVYGFYDPSTNRTYAVLENLTPDMVKGVVLHEVGVHFGFEGLLGIEKYAQVMKRVNVMRLAGNKAVLAAYAEAKQNAAHASQVGEETIAYLVQRNQDMGLVREIIARIKAFLYEKFGIGGDSLNEADLTMLARSAVLHATRTGEGKGLAPAFSRSMADTLNTAANNATVNKVVDKLNEHFTHPGKVSWWDKTVGSPYHLAERSHAFKRVFEAVQRFINDVSFYANEAADLAPKLLPKLDTWRDLGKQPISAADNTAIAAPIYEGTLSWTRDEAGKPVRVADDETAGIVFTDAELKSLFNLTPEQIGLYHQFRDATDKSLDNMAKAEMLRYGGKDVVGLRDMVMDAQDANDAAVLLRDHLIELAKDDEARAGALTETAHGMIERSDKVDKLKKKGYAPLSRFGRYSVDVVVAGKREYFGLFETVHDSNKMAAKMKMMHGAANVAQGTMSQKQFQLFQGITPESLELFGNMLGLESDGDKASDKAFQDYLRLTKNNRSAMKRLIHRKGIAGYSEDVGRTLAAFVYSNARQTAAGLHMGEMGEAVNDIPKVEGELKDAAIELTEYVKNPREEAQALRGLMFAQYLGGSVASAFVNFTQPMTVSFPYLSQFGGAGKAGAALIQAMKDQRAGKVLEPGLARALKIADETGTTQPQAVHELMAQSRGAATLKAGDGTRMGDASALVGNSVAKVALGWGKLFGLAEQINRRSTFIAAYRIAVEQKITDPAGFATKAVNETQFINNKGNKAKFGRGAIGATLMAFKSYSINYLELLHRMATRNGPEGKKAAALMLGMLFLMAGAGGMPGADDLDDVIDLFAQRLGYNFSSQKAKQEFLEGLFGKAGAQFIERGITGLPGAPIDVSGRMSMGNLIPGTGLLLKKSDHTRDVTEVAGAFGDMAIRAFKAGDQLLSGDLGKAILTASPKAASNFAQGVDMASSGMYKDAKGYKVIDTTPTEAAMKAIGFQPASVSKVQEANYLNQRAKDFYSLHAADIRSRWAKGIFEDDKDQVQAARDMMKTWNDNNPDQRIMPNMVAIMRKVHEMRKTKEQRIADTAPKAMRATLRQQIAERAAQ